MSRKTLAPKAIISVIGYEPFEIGGNNNASFIREINFYSTLNSFAFKADVTIEDCDNDALNKLSEPYGSKVILCLYELPDDPTGNLTKSVAEKAFQKTFSVDKVDILEFGITYPYKSVIKVHLTDTFDSLILNKLMCYSNFNVEWKSNEMSPVDTMHYILREYEKHSNKMVIDEKIFGVALENLKRRFATDQNTPLRDVFHAYLMQLYNTRWKEFLSIKSQPELLIPSCLLAYTNQFTIDDSGIMRRTPWLTCANILDPDPDKPLYSVPYPKDGKILKFAHKNYNINPEETAIDLRGGPGAELKDKFIADTFRKYTFNPDSGSFQDGIEKLDMIYPICPGTHPDIESRQTPKYFGIGEDPKFEQMENHNSSLYMQFPYNVKDNQYYYSNGCESLYQDACDLLLKPMVYVSIPNSAWHSPGQEVDLRMITSFYDQFQPDKENYFSMNKLISGRWKIINSVTNFKQQRGDSSGFNITAIETLGLTRTRYFHGELPKKGKK